MLVEIVGDKVVEGARDGLRVVVISHGVRVMVREGPVGYKYWWAVVGGYQD
jgi:hypothetical protein